MWLAELKLVHSQITTNPVPSSLLSPYLWLTVVAYWVPKGEEMKEQSAAATHIHLPHFTGITVYIYPGDEGEASFKAQSGDIKEVVLLPQWIHYQSSTKDDAFCMMVRSAACAGNSWVLITLRHLQATLQ